MLDVRVGTGRVVGNDNRMRCTAQTAGPGADRLCLLGEAGRRNDDRRSREDPDDWNEKTFGGHCSGRLEDGRDRTAGHTRGLGGWQNGFGGGQCQDHGREGTWSRPLYDRHGGENGWSYKDKIERRWRKGKRMESAGLST